MNIIVNQQIVLVENPINVLDVIEKGEFVPPYAVLLNDEFLPYSQYKNTLLKENDNIDIVTAIQGG